jgi:hypothetical protein
MRKILIFVPLLMCATPALAQDAAPVFQLPRELTDPQSAMKLAAKLQGISNALMNVRVGELGAALEGRQATRRERNVTVRDLVHRQDPDFEQHMQQKVATVGPKVLQTMQTLNRTLPQVMHDVDDVQRSLERAVANLPDPTYPQR